MKILKYMSIALLSMLIFSACEKEYLDTVPTNELSDKAVFGTAQGGLTVVDGAIRYMRAYINTHDDFGIKALHLASDVMGEDIVVVRHHWFGWDYKLENRNSTYRRVNQTWEQLYKVINDFNNVIVNIDGASADTEDQKKYVKAQALAYRAFCYFTLIEHYQQTYKGNESAPGIPLKLEPSVEGLGRGTVQGVYDQITKDLDDAIALLTGNTHGKEHISHIDMYTAHGLRARVALVMNDWSTAATHANSARDGYALNSATQFSAGFDDKAEMTWMWGLEVNEEQSTIYASFFSHLDMTIGGYAGLGYSPKLISSALVAQMTADDVRRTLVNASFVNFKFASAGGKEFSSDYVMMRPEEMLLIEAEALARQGGNDAQAQALIKELRDQRYSSSSTDVSETGAALIDVVLLERRFELWGEGFTQSDLMRLKKGVDRNGSNHDPLVAKNMTMPAGSWNFIYQIPQDEIDNNDALTEEDQNP